MHLEAYYGESAVRRKVYLHGSLGETFGKEFNLAVRSPAECIRLLEANFPRKFADAIRKGSWQIIVAGAKTGMQCTLEMCHFIFPKGSIHIVPIPEGSGGGTSSSGSNKTKGIIVSIIGVALIATAFAGAAFLSGAASLSAGFGTAIFGGVTWGQVGLLGAAVLLLGVAILLTPTPKPDEQKPTTYGSYFYSGAVNSDREGGPVPIVYGRVFAGSVVIHGGIFDDKFKVTKNPKVDSNITTTAEDGEWIVEGTDDQDIDDNSDSTSGGRFVRNDPATPVGGTSTT